MKMQNVIVLVFFFAAKFSFAQGDGTSFYSVDECLNKTFNISVHIIQDTLGNNGVTDLAIQNGVTLSNTAFAPICANFNICSTYVHPNVRSNIVNQGIEDKEIATLYDVPNTINIYYVETVVGGNNVCGYAPVGSATAPPISADRDAIFILKSCAAGGTLRHELGHYFGLLHTFDTANGIELVDGSNCETAGDLICDTPAEPDGNTNLDGFCNLNPPDTDPNGDYYTPNACNIMSYLNGSCGTSSFTTGQLNKMLEVMKSGRSYLW